MTCCDEHNCHRRHPIGIYRGDLTGQVYAATSVRLMHDHGDGTGTFAASAKHDITPQMIRFIRANAEWVTEILAEAAAGVAVGEKSDTDG